MAEATVRSGVNLRVQASPYAHIKAALNPGDKLILIGPPDQYNWQCVQVKKTGAYGYVYAPYIRTTSAPETVSKPTVPVPALPPEIPSKTHEASTAQPTPNPVDNDGGTHTDIGTIIITAAIIGVVLIALFWSLR